VELDPASRTITLRLELETMVRIIRLVNGIGGEWTPPPKSGFLFSPAPTVSDPKRGASGAHP
jgi:hypothetical protein